MKRTLTILLLLISSLTFGQRATTQEVIRISPVDTLPGQIIDANWKDYINRITGLFDYFSRTTDTSDDIIEGSINLFDETVVLNDGGITIVTGTYPTFTITSTEVDGSVTNEIQDASEVSTNITNFDGNLSSADTDVQKALETIDDMSGGGTNDHSILDNLDYANANHTDFVSTNTTQTISGLKTFSSPLWISGVTNYIGFVNGGYIRTVNIASAPSGLTSSVGAIWHKTDGHLWFTNNTESFDLTLGGSGSGDMQKSVYDPASINQQLVGISASQNLINKSINGVTLNGSGSSALFLNQAGVYTTPAGGTGTDLSFGGTATNAILQSSTGNDVTFTAGTNITFNPATSGGITINATSGGTTNLSLGTITTTTINVNSSTGTNATLLEANTTQAGILGSDKWDEIVANSVFTTTPSTAITAGTNLSWSGNTLNATAGSVSFGADNEIPFTNSSTNDYDYSTNFTYDGTIFSLGNSGRIDTKNFLFTGQSVSISSPTYGAFWINSANKHLMFTNSTVGDVDLTSTGGSSLWTDGAGYLSPITITDEIRIGSETDFGDYLLQVTGDTYLNGLTDWDMTTSTHIPASGTLQFFAKADGFYQRNSSGDEARINYKTRQALTSSASVAMDFKKGSKASMTLTTNGTLTISDIPDGEDGIINITNGASPFTLSIAGGTGFTTERIFGSNDVIDATINSVTKIVYERVDDELHLTFVYEN